jgi:intracellular sulfur oxidation DsrE/DsrF family protein
MSGLDALNRILLCLVAGAFATMSGATQAQDIRIDVPVVLKEAKVVFNLGQKAFEGDEPTGLQFLRVMIPTFKRDGTKARIVAIFHDNAGYLLLDDLAYARVRNWRAGNPYRDQIEALMREGVEVEECGETMRLRGWSNADLLPNVKVNSGANYRIVQLVQEGFVQLQP